MAAMMLAEMGATVLRIDRVADSDLGMPMPTKFEVLKRSRHIIRLDLKRPEAVALALRLVEQSDALIEGFRPKVMERLGLGPDVCLARNPRLVFGRVTGWGQEGPLAHAAGPRSQLHRADRRAACDRPRRRVRRRRRSTWSAISAAVRSISWSACLPRSSRRGSSGRGQVVDAAMVDGASSLMTSIYGGKASGRLSGPRGTNITDSGAYFYEVYECADGRYVSVAAIEAKFHAELLRLLEIDPATMPPQMDRSHWPEAKQRLANASGPARATSGVRCWKAPTPASRRCCRWMRRRIIRTTARATCSSIWMASPSRRRRRASAVRHSSSPTPPEPRVRRTCAQCSPSGAWVRPRWRWRRQAGYWPERISVLPCPDGHVSYPRQLRVIRNKGGNVRRWVRRQPDRPTL